MGRVIRIFIEKHTAIFCLSVLVVAMGVYSYIVLPRESFPEIKQPFIFVNTSYSGASASDIETLVTKVIESELEGLNGLEEIESTSVQHASSIFLTFNSSVSVEEALRRTKDRVDSAKRDLPNDANDPFVQEFDVSDWPVFTVALTHPSGVEVLETIAEDLKDELRKINGVLEANVEGNIQKELAIELDPYRMATYGISVNDVENAIRQEHKTIPGGTLLSQEKNYSLAVTGELTEELAFQDLMVSGSGGGQVPLASVAEVKLKEARNVTLSRLNGLPSIRVSLKKRIGTNLLELSEQAHTKIDEIKPMLPANTEILVSYDQSTFVKEMLADLENNMASGFILVLLVTIFFLGFRNALFVSLAIPLSMLLSFFVLQSMGITLNMIVLFSLILALGMLVDNGIVIVENIYRHASMGKSQVQAAIDGTSEVIGPVSASTLTTLLAFFPIIFMPGVMGDFMKFLPITVIVVLSSSLFVAVCINPVFCSQYLRVTEKQKRKMEQGSDFFTTFQRWYIKLLKKATKHAVKTILLVTTIVFAGFVVYSMIGKDAVFFPSSDPPQARITIETEQGTPLTITNDIVSSLEELVPLVPMSRDNFSAVTGGDGEHTGVVEVNFLPYQDREILGEDTVRRLQKRTEGITSAVVEVESSDGGGPSSGSDVSYEIRGEEYQVLGIIGEQILSIIEPYKDSFKTIKSDYTASLPEYQVNINRSSASYYGLSTEDIAATIRTAITGNDIGSFRKNNEEYDIIVRYRDEARDSLQMLKSIQLVANNGVRVPLSTVANVNPTSTISTIKRRNQNRAVNITANFDSQEQNRNVILEEIVAQVNELQATLPSGYVIGTGAGSDEREESTQFLVRAFLIAVFLIFIVLVAQFNSLVDPIIIMYAVFLSIGGVMWGFAIGQQNFVIILSGIGIIALAGVAVNNCIVLVDYTHQLIKQGMPWQEAVIDAGRTRLRPVILTALTTVLALIPMAFGVSFDIHTFRFASGSESAEFWKSFAWTMLYGLTFATVTTLVIVPAMLTLRYRRAAKRLARKEAQAQA